jgi:tripartite motif-containing protein 71
MIKILYNKNNLNFKFAITQVFLLITLVSLVGIIVITNNTYVSIGYAIEEYNFLKKFGSQGAGNGKFVNPTSGTFDLSGNLYILDSGNNRIQKFDSNGTYLTKWGSQGKGLGQFIFPGGIDTDPIGNIYVLDSVNEVNVYDCAVLGSAAGDQMTRVQKFSSDGSYLSNWNLCHSPSSMNKPPGITIDGAGNIFTVNSGGHMIEKRSIDGNFIDRWGENGIGNGQFSYPSSISEDSSGNLYVIDSGNHRIQKFTNDGEFITMWGSQGTGDGQFLKPAGITVNPISDDIYIIDSGNHRIQIFSLTD